MIVLKLSNKFVKHLKLVLWKVSFHMKLKEKLLMVTELFNQYQILIIKLKLLNLKKIKFLVLMLLYLQTLMKQKAKKVK